MDRYIFPKRRQEITTTRCIIAQKRGILFYFAAEARNLELSNSSPNPNRIRGLSGVLTISYREFIPSELSAGLCS